METRTLGATDIQVPVVGMGCWPIAGMTSAGVNDRDSLAAIAASLAAGANFFDTAHNYGAEGESELLLGQALIGRRDQALIASKGGLHWEPGRVQRHDARPETLRRQCETSLQRLGTDHLDLLYLHAPDPEVPIRESAGGLRELLQAGLTRSVGISNVTVAQLQEFSAECPLSACQMPYSLLQRQIESDIIPWCREHDVSVIIYWPLVKGLLGGKLTRDHSFEATDRRSKYPMFQGEEWQRNHDFLDQLREIAAEAGRTVAQLAINWTFSRPGITSALCGAKRAQQASDNAGAAGWQLTSAQLARIEAAWQARGEPEFRNPV